MAIKKYDAVATVGEYTNKAGETKKRYMNVGVVFENDKGQLSLKLDALPLNREWSGFISFYEPKERDTQDSTPASRAQTQHNQAKANGYVPPQTVAQDDDEYDPIPF